MDEKYKFTRQQLIDALHLYNNDVLKNPNDYAEFTGQMSDAIEQADEIIRLIISMQ